MEFLSAPRSSLACTQCRNQHLKCDSVRPSCARCEMLSKPCSYPESRRGRKPVQTAAARAQKRRVATSIARSPSAATHSNAESSLSGESEGMPLRDVLLSETPIRPSTRVPATAGDMDIDGALLNLYYQYFHPSHPFVLPRRAFRARMMHTAESSSLSQLATVMRYIGSFYRDSLSQDRDFGTMEPDGSDPNCSIVSSTVGSVVDGFTVQATLLLALAKSMCDDITSASELLGLAIAQATSIEMNKSAFANAAAALDPVLAESWRRTWWMIYLVDTNFAIIRWDFHQFLASHSHEVDLPCDETQYNRLDIPITSPSFEEYQNREYALVEQTYSSFAYFIEASSIYLASLQASTQYKSIAHAERVCSDWEATIFSWFLMLPDNLRELPVKSTVSDQLMFQAHMMMHTSLAFIHRPLSSLQYDSAEERSSCRPPPPPLINTGSSLNASEHEMHSEKLFRAIRKQNQCLVLLPIRAVQLSPFIICMIACCTIAHLVACKVAFDAEETRAARSRIRVTLGTLKHYEDIWPRAKRMIKELKLIANDLLQTKTICTPPNSTTNTTFLASEETIWASIMGEQWMNTLENA